MTEKKKQEKKKGFFGKLLDKLDKKMEAKAQKSPCCGGGSNDGNGSSCC